MKRLRHDERGGILALSAILIPVFIVLAAMVVDVGQWYTHKRQLQNRADAAAFAAGIEYAKNWKACVQGGDPGLQATTARLIANTARQFAADPEAADYAPDPLPGTLYNANVATQTKLDVIVNSWNYTDDNDYSDDQPGVPADPLDPDPGNPCFVHAADSISPGGGHWTDVRVRENDLPSLFGAIGLPLSRNVARARIEIRPALSGTRFLPLAVPDNEILKVQIRYYNECAGAHTLIPGSTQDLAPLPDADQTAWAASGGGSLWGLPNLATPSVGDSTRSFPLAIPEHEPSCGDYLPVGVEVRIASREEIDLNQDCDTLADSKFADCFERLSQIRVWNDGNPDSQPRVKDVQLTGGCPFADGYFGTLPVGATNCQYGVTADVDWGTRDDGDRAVLANFKVWANGVLMTAGSPSGVWSTSGTPLVANPGPNPVTISLKWDDEDPTHNWNGQCRNGGSNPCKWPLSGNSPSVEQAHRTFGGTMATAGAVELVRSSGNAFASGLPGPPFDNIADGGVTRPIFPTIGIRTVLKAGVLTTLRLDDSQANQTLRCDPTYAQGQEYSTFRFGCAPWYGRNRFSPQDDNTWWFPTTQTCPDRDLFFSNLTMPAPYGKNSSGNPWRCVPLAPGFSAPVIGEGLTVATKNCASINNSNDKCQGPSTCLVDGNYDGKPNPLTPGDPGWKFRVGGLGSKDPRVIRLFVVPYQALKGAGGGNPSQTVPVLGFAAFYVLNWTGNQVNNSDPCPDPTFGTTPVGAPPSGAATGVFVEVVEYESGPVDPTAICVEGQLTPCRASLVR